MTRSGVSWCVGPDGSPGFSWNVTGGCSPVSAGCAHCWASRLASTRLAHLPEYAGLAKDGTWLGHARFFADRLAEPLWRKTPSGICVSLMGDLLHQSLDVHHVRDIFGVMSSCPQHRFFVLTKRAKRMREELSDPEMLGESDIGGLGWPLPNVWLGVSIEDRAALPRVDDLRATPAAVRYLSIEPLLEDLGHIDLTGISWVIVGCESGPGARPMHTDWVRSLLYQCRREDVAFFYKQQFVNGRLDHDPTLDGRTWRQMPGRKT